MEDIFSTTKQLKSRLQQPRVYALTLEHPGIGLSIHCVVAYDLEDAVTKARELLIDQIKMKPEEIQQWKLGLFVRKTIPELVEQGENVSLKEIRAPIDSGLSEKNKLMKKIVDNKDEKLLRRSKKLLSPEEFQYLVERLK